MLAGLAGRAERRGHAVVDFGDELRCAHAGCDWWERRPDVGVPRCRGLREGAAPAAVEPETPSPADTYHDAVAALDLGDKHQQYRHRQRAAGRCPHCGEVLPPGRRECAERRAYKNSYAAKLVRHNRRRELDVLDDDEWCEALLAVLARNIIAEHGPPGVHEDVLCPEVQRRFWTLVLDALAWAGEIVKEGDAYRAAREGEHVRLSRGKSARWWQGWVDRVAAMRATLERATPPGSRPRPSPP